jgi:proteasome lid subunit RPN8/RPN11
MNEDQSEAPKPSEWRVPGDEQLETGAYHVWKPRPLLRSIRWRPVPAPEKNAAAGSYDVFVDQRAFKSIHQHLWNASPTEEPFGFLVGDLCEDPDTGRRYVIVSSAVPSKFALAEDSDPQIPGEAIVAMQLEVDRRRGILAGWYHRHRSGDPALTDHDLATHEKHFGEPWHVALLFVTDHERPSGGCFLRTRHGLDGGVPLAFYEMVSNESLLAKGVRRSFMDWANLETDETIERDLPVRPDPPEEVPQTIVPESEPAPTLPIIPEVGVEPDADRKPEAIDEVPGALDDLLEEALEEAPADLPVASEPEDDLEALLEVDLVDDDLLDLSGIDAVEDELPDLPEIDAVEDEPGPVLDDLIEDEFDGLPEVELVDDELEEAAEAVPAADDDLDALPEPGWDDPEAAADVSLPLAADADLESFVTESESSEPAPALDVEPDVEEVEPDWDEPEEEVLEPAGRIDEPEAEVVTKPGKKEPRSRRVAMAAAALLVVVAIAVSLVVFVLPATGGGDEADLAASGDTPASTSSEAGEGELPAGGDGAEGGGVPGAGEAAGEPAAADSTQPEATIEDMERLGDTLLEAVSRFYGLAVAVDGGTATCTELAASYVEVEDLWIDYNVQGRARFRGRLPEELATRDERLYAGVQDVEREYTRSGCQRP